MHLAFEDEKYDEALQGLNKLIDAGQSPMLEEALFRRAQLLLFIDDKNAMQQANILLKTYPNYPLVPYLHLWIAQWAESHQMDADVMQQSLAVLQNPSNNEALRSHAAALGAAAARRSPDWDAVQWLLSASSLVPEQSDVWLREAAARASLSMLGRLRDAGSINGTVGRTLLLDAARGHLITGDMAAVRTLADWLQASFPDSDEARLSHGWAIGETHPATIGLMLPLTGEYASYGRQALRGARLALDSLQDNQNITVQIADTASDSGQTCVQAYHNLVAQGVDLIIGPLTGACTEAVARQMKNSVPVISLTSRSSLASQSPALFVHTLSPVLQASYIADYAMQAGDKRMVVISNDTPSSQAEAGAFTKEFSKLGGDIAYQLVLPHNSIDFRQQLLDMRMHTDDQALLAELDRDLALSAQAGDMDIVMPVDFDAAFLALPGHQVALLAGQLAYVGVNDVRLYGSSRWQDGYLLSDNGRYLQQSRFSDIPFPDGTSPDLSRFNLAWRDIWGLAQPDKLAGLAYDSTLIALLLTHRMGLSGYGLVDGLKDPAGFPGLTGHVRFAPDGLGYKDFEIFRVLHNKIIPAG